MPALPRLRILLAAGVLAAVGAGCGDDESDPATTIGGPQTVTATTPQTTTITLQGTQTSASRTVEGEVEQTATVVPVATFAGQRGQSLGDLDVQASSVLRWSCPQGCERFEIRSADGDDPRLDIQDSGDSGTADVKRGSYTSVRVQADSAWTLTIQADDE
jgi:hypothetical protein